MRTQLRLVGFAAVLALVAACGDDEESSTTTTASSAETSTSTAPTTSAAPTTSPETEVPTTVPVVLEQPAVWPAADVVFATPEEAAADFVESALGVPAVLGEFMAGDSRSGEIEVFFEADGEEIRDVTPRSLLLLRQLGPDNGWFVLAAVNDNVTITTPESQSTVPAAPLTVEGSARGFEATILVSAFVAGDATAEFDFQIAQGGALETPEPYTATLDLSGAAPGEIVVVLVRGSVGLETDPGEFSAMPVVIG